MLKAPSAIQNQQQRQQQQAKNVKGSTKNIGNSISLFKATSKGKLLAFLHSSGRKAAQVASNSDPIVRRRPSPPLPPAPPLEPNTLFPQQTVTGRRGPLHDSASDSATVEQYRHLFKNRPINKITSTQCTAMPLHHDMDGNDNDQHNTSRNKNNIIISTSETCLFPILKQKNPDGSLSQQQSKVQQQRDPANQMYTEREQQLAKEQLQVVRRNLRDCSCNSTYFRRFAAIADDWRNFLPRVSVDISNSGSTSSVSSGLEIQLNDDGMHTYRDGDKFYDAQMYVNEDEEMENLIDSDGACSAKNLDSDHGDGRVNGSHIKCYQPSLITKASEGGKESRTGSGRHLPGLKSTRSYVKEQLHEEELHGLARAAGVNNKHNQRKGTHTQGAKSVTFKEGMKQAQAEHKEGHVWTSDYGVLLDNDDFYDTMLNDDSSPKSYDARESIHTSDDTDDTEANDADADDSSTDSLSYSSTESLQSNLFAATRDTSIAPANAVIKSSGALSWDRRRRSRNIIRDVDKKVLAEERSHDMARSNQQHKAEQRAVDKDQRVRSNEIRNLSVANNGTKKTRSERRRYYRRRDHFEYSSTPQLPQLHAHFGEIRLEDIIRGIESEFTLELDRDHGDAGEVFESEDSLTCLVSEYENSGSEDEDSSTKSERHMPRNHGVESVRSASIASSKLSSSSSCIDTASTLCDSRSEVASDDHTSPSSADLTASRMSQQVVHPPQYADHRRDRPLIPPVYDEQQINQQNQRVIASASASALADAIALAEAKEVEKIKTKKQTSFRPSLTLQTLTHTIAGGIAPGALSAFESRPLGSQYSLTKCNSTSSLYIDSTMAKSDVEETLRAVAIVLYDKVLQSHRINDCRTEKIINSSSYVPSERVVMAQSDIFDFMRFIFDCGQNLGAENAIITLIYVERITELGNLSFHAINWRRLLLGALILSIKVWEDLAVFNSDVCAIFEGLAVKDVNALERFAMARLQYNVSVKRSLYAAYYFRLRDVSEQQHNLHYGKLTLGLSQRDMMMTRNESCVSQHSNKSVSHGGSGLMGISIAGHGSHDASTHHSKVPIGPGYRKWTLKPLSVREADRLEARSSVYCSNLMMEEQERKDAGCCWDIYSSASPEELHNLSVTLLTSMTSSSISSAATTATTTTENHQHHYQQGQKHEKHHTPSTMSTLTSISSNATKVSASTSDLPNQHEGKDNASNSSETGKGPEPVRRALRLKKSRSDFFFQNTTPASIM
ncbi:hypothetical protein BGZ50_004192 [Haplosporangium sp. Z 11]|nr:hypothetical protein BGZ50_004192 [Haplosporangium sp. Z 11]